MPPDPSRSPGVKPGADWRPIGPDWRQRSELPEWVVSETHFGHAAISRYCDRPQDVDALMRQRWEAVVSPRDRVLHLGDVFLGEAPAWLGELPGRIEFLRGNHDGPRQRAALRAQGWAEEQPFWVMVGSWRVYVTHRPVVPPLPERTISVHGHVHNNCPEISGVHINVSAEVQEYRPQRLRRLLAHRIEVLESPEAARLTQQLAELWSRWPRPGHDPDKLHSLRVEASALAAAWR